MQWIWSLQMSRISVYHRRGALSRYFKVPSLRFVSPHRQGTNQTLSVGLVHGKAPRLIAPKPSCGAGAWLELSTCMGGMEITQFNVSPFESALLYHFLRFTKSALLNLVRLRSSYLLCCFFAYCYQPSTAQLLKLNFGASRAFDNCQYEPQRRHQGCLLQAQPTC